MRRPTKAAIDEALEAASRVALIDGHRFKLLKVALDEIEPREEREDLRGDLRPLVRMWEKQPHRVPPPVVIAIPYSGGTKYRILDGHHRYYAALDAQMPNIYVIEDIDF